MSKTFWDGFMSGSWRVSVFCIGLALVVLPVVSIFLFGFFDIAWWVKVSDSPIYEFPIRSFIIFLFHMVAPVVGGAMIIRSLSCK